MNYKTRLRISKWIFTVLIVLLIAASVYSFYDIPIKFDGHFLETEHNRLVAENNLYISVLAISILVPLFILLWSKHFGTRYSVRIAGWICSTFFVARWVASLCAKFLKLPFEYGDGSVPWVFVILLIVGFALLIKPDAQSG